MWPRACIGRRSRERRRVGPDVAGIGVGSLERRREEAGDVVAGHDELGSHLVHRHRSPGRVGGAAEHGPALDDGVDPALLVLRRSEWLSVVEERSPVPVAVPAMTFEGQLQLLLVGRGTGDELGVASACRQVGEVGQRAVEEPAEPDALAATGRADTVHAVVPVAGAHQRESVGAGVERPLEGADAVVVERCARQRH